MAQLFTVLANVVALIAGSVFLLFFSPVILAYMAYVYFFMKPVPAGGFAKDARV
jgi:hypothetical protein